MSDKKLKPVDYDVLIGSGLEVVNPHGEWAKLDDDCGISVFELEDHRWEPDAEELHDPGYFSDGLIDQLREAGFWVQTELRFRVRGPRDGYCWPWEKLTDDSLTEEK